AIDVAFIIQPTGPSPPLHPPICRLSSCKTRRLDRPSLPLPSDPEAASVAQPTLSRLCSGGPSSLLA
ncbi:hypothetical protein, partial [Sporisorium scitamineum]